MFALIFKYWSDFVYVLVLECSERLLSLSSDLFPICDTDLSAL